MHVFVDQGQAELPGNLGMNSTKTFGEGHLWFDSENVKHKLQFCRNLLYVVKENQEQIDEHSKWIMTMIESFFE